MRKWIWLAVLCLLLTGCGSKAETEESPSLKEQAETLPGDYDFDHDGEPDTVEVVTILGEEEKPVWYELRINGNWVQEAHRAHMGWASIFALELEGQDWLLRYNPYMGQGAGSYLYELFSLDEQGVEQLRQSNHVAFDISFGAPHHSEFDPEAIAAFLEEVHGLMEESTVLISTENLQLTINGRGADFWHDDFTGGLLKESDDWAKTLRDYQEEQEAACSKP